MCVYIYKERQPWFTVSGMESVRDVCVCVCVYVCVCV